MTSGMWCWISGSNSPNQTSSVAIAQGEESPSNFLGSKDDYVIFYHNNHIWIFGGYIKEGGLYGYLNDLWKFNLDTYMWTWVSGTFEAVFAASSSTHPGARTRLPLAVTNTSIWIFGGRVGK